MLTALLHIVIICLVILIPVALIALLVWYFRSSRTRKAATPAEGVPADASERTADGTSRGEEDDV